MYKNLLLHAYLRLNNEGMEKYILYFHVNIKHENALLLHLKSK